MTRRKEQESKKYQTEVESLKQELVKIETKYTEETKKVRDQFEEYRKSKNEKFKAKVKEMTSKYERALEQERERVKQLEIEVRVSRQEKDFLSKG